MTELKPNLRKLPFEEFANMMCRPMVNPEALEEQVRGTFGIFSGGMDHMTAESLANGLAQLGRPVDPLVAAEMIHEAENSDSARTSAGVSLTDFCTMNSVRPARPAAVGGAAGVSE